ncbi:MAG: hypothetical protein M3394_08400 [Actinomycetota bacterium]|nr:hypothetical protein [Actinomycetota bacterium]
MQRLRTIPLLLVIAAATLGVHSASAGELDRKACAGSAVLATGQNLHAIAPEVTTSFTVMWNGGTWCPPLSGTLTRSTCTSWTGTGGSGYGSFGLTGEGATIVLTGAVQGVLQLDYTALCNGGTGRQFRATGSLTWTQ